MRAFWSDPYLWIHLAGIAAVPIALLICLLGLSIGDPILPVWLELALIAIAGIVPIAWMQLRRPFYIFGLLAVAIHPETLSPDQRRILTLLRTRPSPLGVMGAAVVLGLILQQLYAIAINWTLIPFTARGLGLGLAAIGFLLSNLFLQVPLSVAQVILTSEAEFNTTAATPPADIADHFLILGLRVQRILPAENVISNTDEKKS
jgi:hypothetical protein